MLKAQAGALAMAMLLTAGAAARPPAIAPPEPATQPLLRQDQIAYVGAFLLPVRSGTSGAEPDMAWGGYALGMGPDGRSLYVGCHDWGDRLARVAIPDIGGEATVVEPCREVPNLAAISGPQGLSNGLVLGGSLWWNDRLVVSAYTYYDSAAGTSGGHNKTHFAGGPTVADLKGPWRLGSDEPGIVAGNMAVVPDEWRPLVGGPVIGGLCCIPIISRSSYGPAISVFDPDDLGKVSKARSTMLAGYPEGRQSLGPYESAGEYYGMSMTMGGLAWPRGTRSVLALVNRPTSYCYGTGTRDRSLDQKPTGTGHIYCYDPWDEEQGTHSPDFDLSAVVFDAADLARVKAGRKRPWDVKPVARFVLPGAPKVRRLQSATFDPVSGRLYLVPAFEERGQVYVWSIQ